MRSLTLLLVLGLGSEARAGVYYSGESVAELPSRWRGFTTDHRHLRSAALNPPAPGLPSPTRTDYLAAAARLEKVEKTRPLTADEVADLGALEVRLGQADLALARLRPASRQFPEHFRIAANLGTAWQLVGDLDRAGASLEEAVRLAPDQFKASESAHLKLVRRREKESRAERAVIVLDDLFGVDYATAKVMDLPPDAAAVIQSLCLALPADGRLLWQAGEIANLYGDPGSATMLLDICQSELGATSESVRKRRAVFLSAAEARAGKTEHDRHANVLVAKSARPLRRVFDETKLGPVLKDVPNPLPWPLLAATTFGKKTSFPKSLEKLDGAEVVLTGFAQPLRDELQLTDFAILEDPVGCWLCETPEPIQMVRVVLRPGRPATLKKGLVKVTGTLRLNGTDPEDFLFTIKDASLSDPD